MSTRRDLPGLPLVVGMALATIVVAAFIGIGIADLITMVLKALCKCRVDQ